MRVSDYFDDIFGAFRTPGVKNTSGGRVHRLQFGMCFKIKTV